MVFIGFEGCKKDPTMMHLGRCGDGISVASK